MKYMETVSFKNRKQSPCFLVLLNFYFTEGENQTNIPKVEVNYEHIEYVKDHKGQEKVIRVSWLPKLIKELENLYFPKMTELGLFPKYSSNPYVGCCQIGRIGMTEAWSDETYYVTKGETQQMSRLVAECLMKAYPPSGGHANSMGSYKARNGAVDENGLSFYHQFSYGIGD